MSYTHTYLTYCIMQIVWWYTSAPNCVYLAECLSTPASECPLSCREIGANAKPADSVTLNVDSTGEGMYTVKAYSALRHAIIAEDKVLIMAVEPDEYPGIRPGYYAALELYMLQEPFARVYNVSQYGGLQPCGGVAVMGACDALGDERAAIVQMIDGLEAVQNVTTVAVTSPVTTPAPPQYVQRCGDGRRDVDQLEE
jgi:hypothetical protein